MTNAEDTRGQQAPGSVGKELNLRGPDRLAALLEGGELEEYILARVEKGSELPIAPVTFTMLNYLTAMTDTSVTDLAGIILKDYGLTSKVLKLVNSVHYLRFGQVTTISRAILLLGFENIKNMAITMSLFEKLQSAESPHLTGLLAKSIYAALLGKALSVKMAYPSPEEAFIGSLFGFLGEILTAFYAPHHYSEIRALMNRADEPGEASTAHRASRFYRNIGLVVGEKWGLPGKVVLCMRPVDKAQTSSKADDDQLHCICAIAHTVADISERERSAEERERLIASYLEFFGSRYAAAREDIKEIRGTLTQEVQDYCSAYGIDFRDTTIGIDLSKEQEQREEPKTGEELIQELQSDFIQSMQSEGERAEEQENPELIFANGMRDVSRALLDEYRMDDIFTIIMETMYRGLRPAGITRTMLLIRNTKTPVMDVRLALGDSTTALRKWFVVSVDPKGEDFFNIALNRGKDLLIKDSSAKVTKKLIPAWLADSFKEPAFVMALPITVKERSIGMIYIEGRRQVLNNIQPSHLHYLKVLHDQAVLAIRKKSGV